MHTHSFPFVYCILVLPVSVVRWIGFMQEQTGDMTNDVPSEATFAAVSIFHLGGVCNVLLFFATRRRLLLFGSDGILRSGAHASGGDGVLFPESSSSDIEWNRNDIIEEGPASTVDAGEAAAKNGHAQP
jgi:hypothetical protein